MGRKRQPFRKSRTAKVMLEMLQEVGDFLTQPQPLTEQSKACNTPKAVRSLSCEQIRLAGEA